MVSKAADKSNMSKTAQQLLSSADRTQSVAIGSVQSDDIKLRFGVPQGSVLGPKLYCIFTKPVGEICRCHGRENVN
jgi:hypothetical protein